MQGLCHPPERCYRKSYSIKGHTNIIFYRTYFPTPIVSCIAKARRVEAFNRQTSVVVPQRHPEARNPEPERGHTACNPKVVNAFGVRLALYILGFGPKTPSCKSKDPNPIHRNLRIPTQSLCIISQPRHINEIAGKPLMSMPVPCFNAASPDQCVWSCFRLEVECAGSGVWSVTQMGRRL